MTPRMTALARGSAALAAAVVVCGCAATSVAGVGATGASSAQQTAAAVEQSETLRDQANAIAGYGSGSVPGVAGCPDDLEALARVGVAAVSMFDDGEHAAAVTLVRSARLCDPTSTVVAEFDAALRR